MRVFWQTWTGILGGWGAQTVIAFALWRCHFPSQLPRIFGASAAAVLFWRLWKRLRRKPHADDEPPAEEAAEPEDEPSWLDLVVSFTISFTVPLLVYCVFALLWGMPLWIFVVVQAELLLLLVFALKPDSDPGPVKTS